LPLPLRYGVLGHLVRLAVLPVLDVGEIGSDSTMRSTGVGEAGTAAGSLTSDGLKKSTAG
jgi:hypothetical protein